MFVRRPRRSRDRIGILEVFPPRTWPLILTFLLVMAALLFGDRLRPEHNPIHRLFAPTKEAPAPPPTIPE